MQGYWSNQGMMSNQGRPSFEERKEATSSEEAADEASEEDSEMEDEEKRMVEQRFYEKLLPEVRDLVKELCGDEKPNLLTDKSEKSCAVCPTTQWFKGWTALLAHASSYKKRRPQQHRGYYRALREALRIKDQTSKEEENDEQRRAVSLNPDVSGGHVVVWPPVVIVEVVNAEFGEGLGMEMPDDKNIKSLLMEELHDLHPTRILPLKQPKSLVVFEASAVGYFEAKILGSRLAEPRPGMEFIMKRKYGNDHRSHKKEQSRHGWRRIDGHPQLMCRGYLAEPQHMKSVDPQRTIVKEWTEESYHEKVQSAQKKSKQEHDKEQAMLKAMELQVENLTEDERRFKNNKEHMERLIQQKEKEVEAQKRRAEDMERRYDGAVRELDRKFQNDMKNFEALSTVRLKRLRLKLEENEKRLEEERSVRTKELDNLRKQFQALTEDHKKQEAQKTLDRELEAMQKRRTFMSEMEKAEVAFNERVRKEESVLQEQQHKEMMQLVEEANRERERILKEWLEKQETLKKERIEPEKAKESLLQKEAEEQSKECAVCWEILNEDNRALLEPCGHAKLCIMCAKEIYRDSRLCPICRVQIKKMPIIFPKKLYI